MVQIQIEFLSKCLQENNKDTTNVSLAKIQLHNDILLLFISSFIYIFSGNQFWKDQG